MKFGSITTPIISEGLIWNMDAANRASYVPNATTSFSTINMGNSGSFEGNPIFLTQPTSASCWQFDGVDDYITCGRDINPTFPGGTTDLISIEDQKFTMNIWFKINTSSTQIAITLPLRKVNAYHGYRALDIGYISGRAAIAMRDYVLLKEDGTTWQLGEWGNLCITYTGNSTYNEGWEMYINGDKKNVIAGSHTGRNYRKSTALGARGGETPNGYFEGEISCCQLYDRPLSSNEVLHNYNALKERFGL
tara:strand:+ start:444 stop:1190 length:747 start_codon:yes stop_codon:yes gene_type:complete